MGPYGVPNEVRPPTPTPAPTPTPTPTPTPAPAPTPTPAPADLVDILELDPSVALEMRYASAENFAKRAVYPVARCRLRRAVAERVVSANRALLADGYRLKLWDCYRPFHVQEAFWALVPDARYVAEPVRSGSAPTRGSKHNRGAAIDVTLIRADGSPVPVPTEHDDFSAAAHRGSEAWSRAQKANSDRLTKALVAEGFTSIATEWWHFDGPGWKAFPLSDDPL